MNSWVMPPTLMAALVLRQVLFAGAQTRLSLSPLLLWALTVFYSNYLLNACSLLAMVSEYSVLFL